MAWLRRACLLWWVAASSPAFAIFSVDAQAPSTGYNQEEEPYTPVSKKSPVVINTQRDQRPSDEPRIFHRPYYRLRASQAAFELKYMRSITTGNASAPSSAGVKDKKRQFSAALGYLDDNIATEFELYVPKSYNYVSSPALQSGTSFTYVAHVQTTCLFANANYLMADFHHVQPYLGAGLGLVVKSISAHARDGVVGQKHYPSFHSGWNVGAGLAFQVTKDLGLDLSYRIIDFGRTKFHMVERVNHVALQSNQARINGWAFGIFYRY